MAEICGGRLSDCGFSEGISSDLRGLASTTQMLGEDMLDHIDAYRLVREAVLKTQYRNCPNLARNAWRASELLQSPLSAS